MQGADDIFLLYQPCFQEAKHRRQLILRVRLGPEDLEKYMRAKGSNEVVIIKTSNTSLEALLNAVKTSMPAILKGKLFNAAR